MTSAVTGRFAPSPTGELHLGSLRTALVAWLSAMAVGGRFIVRVEDLDRVTSSREHERRQLDDLSALGLTWESPVVRQSERFDLYGEAVARLQAGDRVYPCFCTRREIREAAGAPHGQPARYPGTCRRLSAAQRSEHERSGRQPALRLAADDSPVEVTDRVLGAVVGRPDDVVVQRNDGVFAYNLAVVVDDAAQGVTEIVRGDDLAPVTPSQVHLAAVLGLPAPAYAHVPLVLGADGDRLAKRHGAVSLADLRAGGWTVDEVRARLAASLGLCDSHERLSAVDLVDRFRTAFSFETLSAHPVHGQPWRLWHDLRR
jgi:glutamyl-tRNA synthetase